MKNFLKFQAKMGAISKDSTNPFFKSKYFDINKLLEEVKPILSEFELVLIQPLTTLDTGRLAIVTKLIDTETNEVLIDEKAILPENTDPQKMGAIISYFRRYALQSALCLQAEDDDAESVKPKTNQAPTKTTYTPNTYKKPVAPINQPLDPKRAKIITLCKETGLVGADYKAYVLDKTSVELEEKNFDFIIGALEEIKAMK